MGSSSAVLQVLGQVRRVAPYYRAAMITGERDSGEQAVARFLHQLSPLVHRPFVELTAAEAELRFTGSDGYDAVVSEGMLYLSNPESIPPFVQDLLVRMLRERGPQAPRLVAFAERGLRSLVSVGTFSAELADSLGALRIVLPALRERPEDIPELLTQTLLLEATQRGVPAPALSPDFLAASSAQPWPGNFAQLRSVGCSILDSGPVLPLSAHHLKTVLGAHPDPPRRDRREVRMVSLQCIVQEHLRAVLFACNGNKLRAAEILGISRSTLYRMLDAEDPADSIPSSPSSVDGMFAVPRMAT